ncbi:MAG: AsmA-like C-terminal region-containing protein, partial [Rhabdaerophilum calidifontis]
ALFAGARPRAVAAETRPVALRAQMHLDPRGIGLDQLRITRGDRHLSGIATLREVNGRWSLSSTLAGDLVDGSAAGAVLAGLRSAKGEWSEVPLALNPAPWLDLDIRLSTAELRLGRVRLTQAAIAVLTRGSRTEFAIVDSRHGDGTLKARVATLEHEGEPELRLHVAGDRIDARAFLIESLGFDRVSGAGSFVLQAEGRGRSPAAIIRSLAGTGQVEMRGGEVAGIDLARLLQRSGDGASEQALVAALGGRTAYEQIKVNVAIRNGRIEPVGSSFLSARVAATLEGAIDLAQQQDRLIILLRRRQEILGQNGEFFAFRLDGPLFAPQFRPDLSLIGNRS